jgi:hypothetical protein
MSFGNYYCPYPLAYAYEDSDTILWVYEGGNCAIRCPSITFSHSEINSLNRLYVILSAITFTTSFISLMTLIKQFRMNFIKIMFLNGFIGVSVLLLTFFSINHDNSITCDGYGHFVEKNGFCVFQSAVLIFLLNWIQVWSAILAVDTNFHIRSVYSTDEIPQLHQKYFITAVVFCSIMSLVPLCADNLGFDPYANIPICLYMFSVNSYYFWTTTFATVLLFNLTCLVVTSVNVYQIYSIFLNAPLIPEDNNGGLSLYNGESLSIGSGSTMHPPPGHKVTMSAQQDSDIDSRDSSIGLVSLNSSHPTANPMVIDSLHYTSSDYQVKMTDHVSSTEYFSSLERHSSRSSVEQKVVSEVQESFVYNTRKENRSSRFKRQLSLMLSTLLYGGRSFVFLLFFCGSTGFLGYLLLYYYYKEYDFYLDGTESFAGCIAASSILSRPQSQEEADANAEAFCGTVPNDRPVVTKVNACNLIYL